VKVLHVLGELRSSGAEVMLQTAASLWRRYEVTADVLTTGTTPGPYAPELERAGYGVLHLPFERHPRFVQRYGSLLGRGRYDVVHLHMERAFVHLALTARVRRVGVVRTVHSNFPFDGGLRRRRTRQRRLARKASVRFAAIGATVGENEHDRFSNPTTVVHNWIDTDRFRPTPDAVRREAREGLLLSPDDFVAVAVGNCSTTKNHAALLQALSGLDEPVVLLHVGEEEPRRPEWGLARDLAVSDRCRFLGRVDPEMALRAADVFVMPSLHEGLSIASLEALATGLPAVLTDVPGNVDLRTLSDDIIWSSTDENGLRRALSEARARFRPPRMWASRVEQSERVRSRHSAAAGVAGYVQLYHGVV
jgi:glycosyltransferase involved in cell wall biosynthesis